MKKMDSNSILFLYMFVFMPVTLVIIKGSLGQPTTAIVGVILIAAFLLLSNMLNKKGD